MEINPDKRKSFEEYYNHYFFKETQSFRQNFKIKRDKNISDKNSEDAEKMNKVKDIAKSFVDIMDVPNCYINMNNFRNENKKVSNIIYYDENIEKHLEEIHNDSDIFENETNGVFFYVQI